MSQASAPRSSGGQSRESRYRKDLRGILGASAGPYGYTLSIWGSGSMLSHTYGTPGPADIFLFLAGAVVAFAVVGTLAFGGAGKRFEAPRSSIELFGSFHFVSVGLAVAAALLAAQLAPAYLGWPLGPALATATYLLVVGAEHTLAETLERSSGGDGGGEPPETDR
jgi:hypothetical protein